MQAHFAIQPRRVTFRIDLAVTQGESRKQAGALRSAADTSHPAGA